MCDVGLGQRETKVKPSADLPAPRFGIEQRNVICINRDRQLSLGGLPEFSGNTVEMLIRELVGDRHAAPRRNISRCKAALPDSGPK